ncbi:MAG TPA: DUF4391 domain-containing protein [Candidatus Aphodousia faecipullorum]|nr:DUF4391 domain-containing protein [Candidatus Aphodousia faecipullorum]
MSISRVFHSGRLCEAVLYQIDKKIPYNIFFILTCDGKEQARIGNKKAVAPGSNAFKVSQYYHTDWVPESELQFCVNGLNMNALCGRLPETR